MEVRGHSCGEEGPVPSLLWFRCSSPRSVLCFILRLCLSLPFQMWPCWLQTAWGAFGSIRGRAKANSTHCACSLGCSSEGGAWQCCFVGDPLSTRHLHGPHSYLHQPPWSCCLSVAWNRLLFLLSLPGSSCPLPPYFPQPCCFSFPSPVTHFSLCPFLSLPFLCCFSVLGGDWMRGLCTSYIP